MRNKELKKIISDNYAKRKNINRPLKLNFKKNTEKSFDSIFLTGGIGDVLAVESFMTEEERQRLKTIYYATKKEKEIREIVDLFNFPNLKSQISIWTDFSKFWCFYDYEDYLRKGGKQNINNFKDFSICPIFHQIKSKERHFNGSSILKKEIKEIGNFDLPQNFYVFLPFSTDKRIKDRDFSKEDWANAFSFIKSKNCYGVVINNGNDIFDENNENLINLTNKTTLTEAIQILKKSKGYIGIDSWLSVLASQLFECENIQIKSNNSHCKQNLECYFSPKKEFSFIKKGIEWIK